jgi:hypothetical protein
MFPERAIIFLFSMMNIELAGERRETRVDKPANYDPRHHCGKFNVIPQTRRRIREFDL